MTGRRRWGRAFIGLSSLWGHGGGIDSSRRRGGTPPGEVQPSRSAPRTVLLVLLTVAACALLAVAIFGR
ncbi:hypothetical protein [Pseudonocardia sp.]|uniref:hypothetical protein n=1 Tax=Pseudonocardia sp. TaxID=60912 RepID=UPI00260D0F3E|nr:hypothetical protein [Pseudonocardia sp.]